MSCGERAVKNSYYVTVLKHLDLVTTNEESLQEKIIDFNDVLKTYIDFADQLVHSTVIRSVNEFENSFSALMKSLLVFVDGCLAGVTNQVPSRWLDVVTAILDLICTMTDKIVLIPMFIDIGFVEAAIRWIGTDIFGSHINWLGGPIFGIVYNLSREKAGLKQLRERKAFEVLMERKQLVNNTHRKTMTKHFGTTLIALATSDQQSEENIRLVLDTSVNLYKSCMAAGKDRNLSHDGYHISEILELLYRAFSNTIVRKHILQMKVDEELTSIGEFSQLFLSMYGALLDPEPDELEKRAVEYLLKILLQISSYQEYLKELTDNSQFYIIIESLKNRPKQNEASRIWCNIQQKIPSYEAEEEKTERIYISYDWADEDFCREFIKKLREKITIPISVDYEGVELSDETGDYSSRMIESATVIVALVSSSYGESTDKFIEISYIISSNKSRDEQKSLILVKAEPNFKFNRYWMEDLFKEKALIGYDDNIGDMADKVCEQIVISNKSLLQYVIRPNKNRRTKTATSGERISKPVSNIDSTLSPTTAYTLNESLQMTDSSRDLLATKKQKSYSVVSVLDTQTGSAGSSTWV